MTTIAASSREFAAADVVLRFPEGLPGLEHYRTFRLLAVDDVPVYLLRCEEEPAIQLPVAEPYLVLPDYAFDLSDADVERLELSDPRDVLVLIVLTMPRAGHVTANLLAPIVVNRLTGRARQVVLDGSGYGLRHRLDAILS